jgi:hypothetical protein
MASDDPIRASDADREVVVASLQDAYTAGRLDLDEFDERTSAAYESKTWGDLRLLTIDLPAQPILGGDVPGRQFASQLPPPDQLSVRPPQGTTQPVRRGRPMGFLIPLFVWIVIMSHAPSGSGVGVLVVSMFVIVVILSAIRRR